MYQLPAWLAVAFLVLLIVAALRRLGQRRAHMRRARGEVDDDAVARIIHEGVLVSDEDEPLDEEEIRSAEEEFWDESWEEPEPYSR